MSSNAGTPREVDTLVIGAGQAGLAMSYWLTHHGVEHVLLERRGTLGGAWLDRWDSFCLNTPNFALSLPGLPYEGNDPDGFLPRDAAVGYFRNYAARIAAPVQQDTEVTRVARDGNRFTVETAQGAWSARNVVLANGAFQEPRVPPVARNIPPHVLQLHSHNYRNPGQLPAGAVLVVGTGQSGGQITEDLLAAGREVHLSVGTCPEAPRRYRGQDVFHWLLQVNLHGPEHGINGLMVDHLPSPAARFACNPLLSGNDGGHSIHLRDLGRRGVRLHGRLEAADGGDLLFSDDLPERLAMVEAGFGQRLKLLADSYIAAAGIQAPEPEAPAPDSWLPEQAGARLSLGADNVTSVIWATGYRLDNSFLDMPVLDEWNFPRHRRGVTEVPGLYAVGLPWLTRHMSATLPGVGPDAEFIAGHIAGGSG
ncbi:flavin-containing monooxygenase [Pseudarthrobacter sulfonivorans]|uniref:flavin-containing monooxygenase n=1 Tax=Pseudarthrobacter sulfonivorans TaxID=121292 RepID=UPI002107BFC2|nr:NAD(P)/FAD-dependent oxidoreductase [Pseudarthrobacter sulfonivorans]